MLCTERLNIIPYRASFYQDLRALFCDNNKVMQWALHNRSLRLNEFENLLKKQFVLEEKAIYGFYCIQSISNQKIIGVTGLFKCNYIDKKDIEFGFILAEPAWGKGYAQELGRFWLHYAAHQLKYPRIIATTSPYNHASQRVLEKLNMRFYKSLEVPQRGRRYVYIKDLDK